MANTTLTQTGQQVQADLNLTENLQEAFSTSSTYIVGSMVIYDSKIWKCHTAVSSAGSWTGTTNWTQIHLSDLQKVSNGATNGQVLTADGSGSASWQNASGGGGTQWYQYSISFKSNNVFYTFNIYSPSNATITDRYGLGQLIGNNPTVSNIAYNWDSYSDTDRCSLVTCYIDDVYECENIVLGFLRDYSNPHFEMITVDLRDATNFSCTKTAI